MTKERRGMFHLDVLIEKENNHYTAHCLQFDLVADGKTKESAKKNIMDVIVEYICFAYRNNWENLFSNRHHRSTGKNFVVVGLNLQSELRER